MHPLIKTYGGTNKDDFLNIYCPDRNALVKSLKVYYQINFMMINRNFGSFPKIDDAIIEIDWKEESKMNALQEELDIISNR